MNSSETRALIEERIRERLAPVHLEVHDDSGAHAGHPGVAVQGGGHFRVLCVSEAFEERSLIEQHRLIHEAVGYPLEGRVHALEIKTIPKSRWREG